MADRNAEVAIIGAGIAGLSLAAKLSTAGLKVVVIDQFSHISLGATGRSAALLSKVYSSTQAVAILTAATQQVYDNPAPGFSDVPLLTKRGAVFVAGPRDAAKLRTLHASCKSRGIDVALLDASEVATRIPILRDGEGVLGVEEVDAMDLDVDAIVQGYARQARAADADVIVDSELLSAQWNDDAWTLHTRTREIKASVIVNAAGAWSDVVAQRCGVRTIGLRPLRRTAMVAVPETDEADSLPAEMPFVFHASNDLYWCYRGGRFLISPADETLSSPCDAQPDDEDVAVALDAFQAKTRVRLSPARPKAWAGLRTFASDRNPIVGFSDHTRFFWFAGQGGFGIQTADAMASLAAGLIMRDSVPESLLDRGLQLPELTPDRFMSGPSQVAEDKSVGP